MSHTFTAAAHSQTFEQASPHCEILEEFTQFDQKQYIEIQEKKNYIIILIIQ